MIFDLLKLARNKSWRERWPPGPPRIHSVHPDGVIHHLMRKFPAKLQIWNQFPAFVDVPIWKFRVHLSHIQVQLKVSIQLELTSPCPIEWDRSISSIVVVIYLVGVAEVQSKWLPILELTDRELTIPSLVFPSCIRSIQLFECHPGGYNLHDILWSFEAKNIDSLNLRTC